MSVHCLCMYQVVVVKPKGYHTGSNNVASNVLLHECLSACIQFWSSLAIIHTVGTCTSFYTSYFYSVSLMKSVFAGMGYRDQIVTVSV